MKAGRAAIHVAILGLMAVMLGAFGAASAIAFGLPTALGSSQNPSPACSSVTFTATVYGGPTTAGAVQFFDGLSPLGGPQAVTPDFDYTPIGGLKIVPTTHGSGSISVSLPGGTHIITFAFVGDVGAATGGPYTQRVTAATSTTAVTSSVNPSVFGQPVALGAAVSSSCSGSVAGSVQFQADGANLGGPQPLDASGHASTVTAGLGAGNHPITAAFTSSNSDVGGSGGSLPGGQNVKPADTTTGVTSSTSPSEFGATVAFTATTTAKPPGGGTPSGTVQFQDNGANLGAPRSLAGGSASITTSSLAVGSHTISASFTSAGPNFNNSAGNTTQTVNRARTTLSYNGAVSADFNDAAVLSAKLARTDDGSALPGKTVTLTMGSESCTSVTGAGGEAACTITPAEAAGPFTATAAFTGDGNYLAATDSKPFAVTREETTTVYTGPTVIAQSNPVALSARLLEDATTPIAGRTLTLTLGSGSGSQSCVTGPSDASGNARCTVPSVTVTQGPQPVKAAFAGDGYYLPSLDASKSVIVFAFPSRGIFVLGDQSLSASPATVTFWGAQWMEQNSLSGGVAPPAFKGFADEPSSKPPACGGSWTTSPGNSSAPVDSVPAYMGTAVSSAVSGHGGALSGTIKQIVVVVTASGYAPNPGHPGSGEIIATYC